MDTMTAAQVTATRHLIGLSQQELADALHVGRHAVKDWESGRFTPKPGVIADLLAVRGEHDHDTARMMQSAHDGIPIEVPRGPRPDGWYLAAAARTLDQHPDALLAWQEPDQTASQAASGYTATVGGHEYRGASRLAVAEQIYGDGVELVASPGVPREFTIVEPMAGHMRRVLARIMIYPADR